MSQPEAPALAPGRPPGGGQPACLQPALLAAVSSGRAAGPGFARAAASALASAQLVDVGPAVDALAKLIVNGYVETSQALIAGRT